MITRRQLIANASLGAAGLALLPFTEHMQVFAAGDAAKLPKRFVFFTTAHGIHPSYLMPDSGLDQPDKRGSGVSYGVESQADQIVDRPLGEVGLPPWMASLQPFVDRTSLVSGLSGKMCRGWHSVSFGALGAQPSGDKGKPRGETIDGALAKALPGIFPHMAVSAVMPIQLSATAAGVPLPTYSDPIEVYDNLFGVVSSDSRAKRRNRIDGQLLDFMADDVRAFQRRLPGAEREKLDFYLGAYEQMSRRHRQLLAKKAEIERLSPPRPVGPFFGDGAVPWEDRAETMCDLVTLAMIAGLTNVATINLDGGSANGAMYGKRSGFEPSKGGHGFGHGGLPQRVKAFGFNTSMVAHVATKLDAVPEGDGTMLDHTVLLMVSTSGSQHHTRCENFPMVLVGNCGGKLRMGRHVQYPGFGKNDNRTIGNMYTTLLHAAGLPRKGFGFPDAAVPQKIQEQPLAELIA